MMKYFGKSTRWTRWLLVAVLILVITSILFQNLLYEQPIKLYETFNSQSCEQHHQQQGNNIIQKHYPTVIIMEKTFVPTNGVFSFLSPGTDHWYHFLEHIIINLPYAKENIWIHGTSTNSIHSKNPNSIMYIIFQEKQSTDKLNEFGVLLLTSILSGGLFHHVKIGYTDHSDVTLTKLFPHDANTASVITVVNGSGLGSMKNYSSNSRHHDIVASSMSSVSFTETHSVKFPSSSSSSIDKTDTINSNASSHTQVPRFIFETSKPTTDNLKSVSATETICITKSQTFIGKFTLPIMNKYNNSDTYEWFGRLTVSLDLYVSFRQAVSRLCANSYLNDNNVGTGSSSSTSTSKSDTKMKYNNNSLSHSRRTLAHAHPQPNNNSNQITSSSSRSKQSRLQHSNNTQSQQRQRKLSNDDSSQSNYIYMSDNEKFKDRKNDFFPLNPTYIPNKNYQNLVIYQRDVSRRLINAEYVYSQFSKLLNNNNNNNNNNKTTNYASANSTNNVSTASSLSSSSLSQWNVEIFMHSNQRSVCDLIEKISTTTIFVTPHGFQSILLLFQPLSSVFIEIHPYLYFKPNYYGDIQTSFRNHLHLSRSYIAEESQPDRSILGRWIHYFKQNHWLDEYICGHSVASRGICRYIFRLQSVTMTQDLIEKVVQLIQQYYIIR